MNELTSRATVLRREIGLLSLAHSHLSGVQGMLNASRISERKSELETVEAHIEIMGYYGEAEMVRCDELAANA